MNINDEPILVIENEVLIDLSKMIVDKSYRFYWGGIYNVAIKRGDGKIDFYFEKDLPVED